jgi:hypothetical protein
MILIHLGGEGSNEEKDIFAKWLEKSERNKALLHSIEVLWNGEKHKDVSQQGGTMPSFFRRFTKQKIKTFLLKQALGHLIGFIVGMWVTATFSHTILEKRGIRNLFGLRGRKEIVVNEIPEWLQSGIAILAGFIVLELINHFFQTEKHLILWKQIKTLFLRTKEVFKDSKN